MAATAPKKSTKVNFAEEINKAMQPDENMTEVKVEENSETLDGKKKAGRPASGPVTKITLAVPDDLYENVITAAAIFHKGNKTSYINSLIKKDMEENMEKYKEFQALLESAKK